MVEYEPDSESRAREQIPLLEQGRIEAFIRLEMLPTRPTPASPRPSFIRNFHPPPALRSLAQISADMRAMEQETEGLLTRITGVVDA